MGVITAVTLVALLAGQETTTRIQLSSEEIAELSCSPALVSSSDLSRWMELSECGPFSELITVIICPDHPPDVVCGREPNTLNLRMASLDLEKNRELISKLNKDNCPSELSSVVAYFKKSRSFWLWLETQKLQYLETGDTAALREPFDDINTATVCADVIARDYPWAAFPAAYHLKQKILSTEIA